MPRRGVLLSLYDQTSRKPLTWIFAALFESFRNSGRFRNRTDFGKAVLTDKSVTAV
jgi:hypothetical protein